MHLRPFLCPCGKSLCLCGFSACTGLILASFEWHLNEA
nr:MAG TPA: hypothetical protein [Caudoviricetes sp.]